MTASIMIKIIEQMRRLFMNYDHDYPFIPAHHQLSLLIDFAEQYGVDHHILLSGSGIFLQDILQGKKLISYHQFQYILNRANHLFKGEDLRFLFGERCLTTSFNDAFQSIRYAKTLDDVFARYIEFHALVCPWLIPKIIYNQEEIIIYWLNSQAPEKLHLIEMTMSAVKAMCQTAYQKKLDWIFEFNSQEPEYIEQYWTHLGSNLKFNQPIHCMRLSRSYLADVLPQHALTISSVSYLKAQQYLHEQQLNLSFLEHIDQYIMQNIQYAVTLEQVATYFNMSPATLKRRLKKHNTHFQAQLDQSRLHTAIILNRVHGFKAEQIAQHLAISDLTNFKRALKRWCGQSSIMVV